MLKKCDISYLVRRQLSRDRARHEAGLLLAPRGRRPQTLEEERAGAGRDGAVAAGDEDAVLHDVPRPREGPPGTATLDQVAPKP